MQNTEIKIDPITNLVQLVGAREAANMVYLSKKVAKLESRFILKLKKRFEEIGKQVFSALIDGEPIADLIDVSDIIMEMSIEAMTLGVKSTQKNAITTASAAKLTAPPKLTVPKSLKEIRRLWDEYRKWKRLPPRVKKHADAIKKAYLKQVQSVWEKNSRDFRQGKTAEKAPAIAAMMDQANIGFTRGKMIVQTETTFFYNQVRREIYDQADGVTHYLFVALRDHATTPWCKTRQHLVYAKGDPLLDDETPPCHWNCRSELLPLTPSNPNHLRLIKDKGKARRNNKPEPLPPEWMRESRKKRA